MIKGHLFNLVLYVKEERRSAYLRQIAHNVLQKFPCRLIFIQGDTDPNSDYIETISGDDILIKVGTHKLSLVPFLVIPQLIPDLPIYLIWGQDPTEDDKILPSLEKYATRLIFDSECTLNLQRFAKQMLLLINSTQADIMDLNWAYSSGWRDACAKVFATDAALERLHHAKKIVITYNGSPEQSFRNHETQAIYLQAWLSACLGWKLVSRRREGTDDFLVYNGPTIELKPETTSPFPGAISKIEIETDTSSYVMTQKKDQPKITVHVTTEASWCELPFTLPLPDFRRRSVFLREIFYQTTTSHYKKTLESITSTSWENL